MTKVEQLAFMTGVTMTMKSRDMNQKQLADIAGTTAVTISRYKNGLGTPSEEWIGKICVALGKSEKELIKMGSPTSTIIPPLAIPSDYIDPDALVLFAQTLASQQRKTHDRLKFWREVYETLPAATLIIKDNIVVYQNGASRALGPAVGAPLCGSCFSAGSEHCGGDECPVQLAMANGQCEKHFKSIGDVEYLLIASPMRYSGCEYFIVLAVDVTREQTTDEVNP